MTNEEIDVAIGGGTLLQQFGLGNVHIENLFPLSLALRNPSIEKKVMQILQSTKNQPNVTDVQHKLMIEVIRACKCRTYKHTRLGGIFDRTVIVSTHPDERKKTE